MCARAHACVCVCVCVLVAQSCPTLCNPGLQPARLLCPWNSPGKNTRVGSHGLLHGIFLTQRSNPGLLHCRWILYCLSHQGRWGQWLVPSWQSRGAGGWLHQGDEDSDRGCVMGPLLVGCLCSQECGGSNPHLLSGPSVVAEGSPYYPIGFLSLFLSFFLFFYLTFCLLF